MNTVEFSRCFICKQIASRGALEPGAELPGLVCVDKSACEERVAKSQQRDVAKDGRARVTNGDRN